MKKIKKIVSIICVILLLLMIIATLVAAFLDNTEGMWIFKGCLATTIFIPIAAYAFICIHKFAMTRSGRKDYYSDKQ